MPKYRKKLAVIEAEQWFEVIYDREAGHGITPEDMPIYHLGVGYYRRPEPEYDGQKVCPHCGRILHDHGWIDIRENGRVVCPGDWITTDANGEKYPCKPDLFEQTYDGPID